MRSGFSKEDFSAGNKATWSVIGISLTSLATVKVQPGGRVRVSCEHSQTSALSQDDFCQCVRPLTVSKSQPHSESSFPSPPASIPQVRQSSNGSTIFRVVQRRRVQRSHPQAERRPRDKSTQTHHLQAERVFPQAVWNYQLLQGESFFVLSSTTMLGC